MDDAGLDEAGLDELGAALADAVEAALPGWALRAVTAAVAAAGGPVDEDLARAAEAAGRDAAAEVVPPLRRLLAADLDRQWANPLAVVRGAVGPPTALLRRLGVAPVERDDFARDRFPDDDYDLTPASFAAIHPDLAGPGLAWGAAKAMAHRARHGTGGEG